MIYKWVVKLSEEYTYIRIMYIYYTNAFMYINYVHIYAIYINASIYINI